MYDSVRVGDRVVITKVHDPNAERFVGVQGKVVDCFGSGRHFAVHTDGNVLVIAAAVEMAYSAENHSWRDEEAAVGKLHRYGIIDDETLRHELQRINDERSRTSLDRRRTQAAEFAHRTLGTDALLEDVIGLAEWILDNPDASPKDVKEHITVNPGGVLPSAHNAETIESMRRSLRENLSRSPFFAMTNATDPIPLPEPTPTIPPDDLAIRDKDGDRVAFSYLAGPHYFAMVEARNTDGDVCSAYITAEDADRIIAFLQDAKAAKA